MDLIDREQAIEVADAIWVVTGDKNVAKVWQQLQDLPSAEKTGRWEPIPKMGDAVQCSNCKKYWTWTFNTCKIDYCPNCGARMVPDEI